MTLAHSATLPIKFQDKFLGKIGNNSITATPAFLVKESETGGDKKDHESEQCTNNHVLQACVVKNITKHHYKKTCKTTSTADQERACIMILAHSATLRIKCQVKRRGKFITLCANFNANNSTAVSLLVALRGRATKQQRQPPENSGQKDHNQASKFIYGDVPLLKSTIETPNEATIQRETQA